MTRVFLTLERSIKGKLGFRIKRKALIGSCLFISIMNVPAALAATSGSSFRGFQFGNISAVGSGSQMSFSGEVAWTPVLSLTQSVDLRMNFGGSLFKGTYDTNFYVGDAAAVLTYNFTSLSFGVGGGAEYWDTYGTYPLGRALILWRFAGHFLWMFDRFYMGYSYLMTPNSPTHLGQAGFGITL